MEGARDQGGLAVAAAVAVKPVFVPLLVWLLLTRRRLAAAVGTAGAVALIVLPWAAIGFDGLRGYPRLLDRLEATGRGDGHAAGRALLARLGPRLDSSSASRLRRVALVAVAARLRRRPDGDLASSRPWSAPRSWPLPIVWPHYLALLLVPLAVARPRAAAAWALPYALPLVLAIDGRVPRGSCFILLALAMTAVPLMGRAVPRRGIREPSPLRADAQGSTG